MSHHNEHVKSVIKAFAILEILSGYANGAKLTQISNDLDLPLSTTHRIIDTLVEMGYIKQSLENGRYYFGHKLKVLADNELGESPGKNFLI